jgi:hypothetical protein
MSKKMRSCAAERRLINECKKMGKNKTLCFPYSFAQYAKFVALGALLLNI